MADEKYPIPENPQYNPDIRKLLDSDPARASTVFNPVLQQMIENTAAVKKQADETKEKVAQSAEQGAGGITLGDGTTVEQAVNDLRAGKADLDLQTGKVRADLLPSMDYVPADQKGAAGGVAELDSAGKVPAAQLPSFVDDVLEYATLPAFPATGEAGKIYVTQDTNKTYRWSGSGYVEISQGVALGETSATAYRGDRGKEAYEHSNKTGNPHGTKAGEIAYTDNKGLGATTVQGAVDAAAQASKDAQKTADDALDAITKLAHTIDAIPSQNGSLTYTGSAQSPSWNSFNPDTLILGGTTVGTNAGTYTATFKPVDGYTWSDGTADTKSVAWIIGRASVAKVPTQSGSLTYNGAAQTPTWNDFNSAQLALGGTTTSTAAGSYNATFTPTANFQWADGTTAGKTATWSIGRATISAVPSQSGSLTYTGSAQSPSWSNFDSAKMTIGGTQSGTNAGSYNATFTPTSNYKWSDGSTAAKSVAWSIGKAAGSLSLNPTSLTLNKATSAKTITATRAGNGTVTASSSNTAVATVSVSGATITVTGKAYGTATITVSVAAGTNHNAPASKTCSVQVNLFNATLNSNTWAAIRGASDANEGANYWSVGATKTIKINGKAGNFTFSNLSVDVFILGFNHNSSREGGNRIHFQIGKIGGKMVGLCDGSYNTNVSATGYFSMNSSNTNNGGWKSCQMRTTILGNNGTPTSPTANTLLAAMPSDLRAVMKATTKYSDNSANGTDVAGNVTATTDYLFLLAEFEAFGARYYANSAEQNYQAQYEYYRAGNSRVAYKHDATSTTVWWWLRSARAANNNNFCNVNNDGSYNNNNAYYSAGVLPGFCECGVKWSNESERRPSQKERYFPG